MYKSAILRIVSILILLTIPVLIYGMGLWETALEKEMSATFEYAPIIGKLFITNFLVVAWWLLIAWLVAFRDDREPVMAIFYGVFGLILIFFSMISYLPNTDSPLIHWLMEPPFRAFRIALLRGGISSPTNLSGLFILLVGVLGLRPKRKARVKGNSTPEP